MKERHKKIQLTIDEKLRHEFYLFIKNTDRVLRNESHDTKQKLRDIEHFLTRAKSKFTDLLPEDTTK